MNDPVYEQPAAGVTPDHAGAPPLGWWDRLVWAVLPAGCLGCAAPLPARVSPLGLCGPCRGRLSPVPADACDRCGRPLATAALPAGYCCGDCRADPPAYDRLLALWKYAPPLDAVVQGLKFGRLDYLGGHLAEVLAGELGAAIREQAGKKGLMVPVPLHWRRRLTRGFNQAERIARPLARRLGLPLSPALARRRATPPQSRLDQAARLRNLRQAFVARDEGRIEGRHVVLVDDVATTGATLDTAAAALKAAGAAAVTAVVAGRTPIYAWE